MSQKITCAAILANGKSSRMGREKALIEVQNQPLVRRIAEVLQPIFPRVCVVTDHPEIACAARLPAVSDLFKNRGPLGGIHAALGHFQAPSFVVACDMPFLNADFLDFLSENFAGDALVPLSDGGFEPLHAVYGPQCLAVFEAALQVEQKMPPFRALFASIDTRYVPVDTARLFDPALRCFTNWNTPEDAQTIPARPET